MQNPVELEKTGGDPELAWRVLGEFDWDGKEARGAVELLLDEAGK